MQAKTDAGRLESRSSLLLLKSMVAMRSVLMFSWLSICKWACSQAHREPFLWKYTGLTSTPMASGKCCKPWPKTSFCHFRTLLRYTPGTAQFKMNKHATWQAANNANHQGGQAEEPPGRPQARKAAMEGHRWGLL